MNLLVKSIKIGGQQQGRLIPEILYLQNVDLCMYATVSATVCLSLLQEFQGEHICDPPRPRHGVKVSQPSSRSEFYRSDASAQPTCILSLSQVLHFLDFPPPLILVLPPNPFHVLSPVPFKKQRERRIQKSF